MKRCDPQYSGGSETPLGRESNIFAFKGLHAPVMFTGCEALYPIFTAVLRDWPMVMTDFLPGSEVVITLERIAGRYERRSTWQPEPVGFRDPVDAVCDFIVDLIHAYVAEHQKNLCLHGAAVELGAGLMVFPNTYRAGKSILSIKLVSLGAGVVAARYLKPCRCCADDRWAAHRR